MQVLLRQYRKPLQALFDRLMEHGPPDDVGLGLSCRQATDWLEQSGGIGEYHVKSRSGSANSSQSLSSFLTVHLAGQAFVDSLPLQLREGRFLGSCLASSRQFQEWLVRCAELKYCAVEQLSLAARTNCLLQNVIDGRSTEDVLLQVTQASATATFDPRSCTPTPGVSASLLKFFLAIWDQLDMSAIYGLSGREQKVFELLLSHLASLVNTFAYYCGSSLRRTEPEAIGLLELQGWSKFVMDGHVCTKSFSARAAYEVYQMVLDSIGTQRIGLDLAEFLQCLLACAFQRSNAARVLLHEKTAHSVFPVDHCLKAFLSSVLPHLRARNVLDFHLECAKSAGLQRMLVERQDAVFQSLAPSDASLKAGLSSRSEAGMSLDAFLTRLDSLGLLRALKIELDVWNPVDDYGLSRDGGEYSRKVFKSVLTSEDVKQAVVDTVLTFALTDGTSLPCGKGVASMPLSAALLLQTMVRLAAVMYSQIPHLQLEQRVATFFGHLLSPELDAGEAVMRHMSTHSPARTSSVVIELAGSQGFAGYTARQHAFWLAVWQDVDLSRLPGFPMWERRVFEVLQACWPELRSIFHFYCKRSNCADLKQSGQMTLPAFLLWADDCMMRTKLFPQARIKGVFNYCVMRRSRTAGDTMPDVDAGGALVSKVARREALSDAELEVLRYFASGEASSSTHAISFASFVECVVRCSFLRANLKWQPGIEELSLVRLVPLPGCLHRFLEDCPLRFSQRGGLAFSKRLLTDAYFNEAVKQRQEDLASLCLKLAAADEAPAFNGHTRLPIAVDDMLAMLREKGVLGQAVVPILRTGHDTREATCTLSEQHFLEAWHDGRTFAMGCAGGDTEVPGLSQREFVEILARCAQHKYAEAKAMHLAQRFLALVGNLVDGRTVEDSINEASRLQPRKMFAAEAEPAPIHWSTDDQEAWLSIWEQLDLSELPDYPDSLRPVFLTLQGGLRDLLPMFSSYSRNGGQEGSLSQGSWQRFTHEAALVTRALDTDRLASIFLAASITTKVGEQVLRVPQFLQARISPKHACVDPKHARLPAVAHSCAHFLGTRQHLAHHVTPPHRSTICASKHRLRAVVGTTARGYLAEQSNPRPEHRERQSHTFPTMRAVAREACLLTSAGRRFESR